MHTIHRFDTLGAFADCAAKLEASPSWRRAGHEERTKRDSAERTEFTGAESFAQALDFARLGWSPGLAAMRTARAAMPRPTARGRARRFDVAGAYADAARAAAGDPASMATKAPEERKGKTVLCLVMPGSTGAHCKSSAIANQATAICGLIDALEGAGLIRCELWRHLATNGGGHAQTAIIRLKAAEDTLELSRLAGALAPSTYRRLWLRFTEAHEAPGWARATKENYGYPRPVQCDREHLTPGALILPLANNLDDSSPESSWRTITAWAAEHGFPLDD